MRAAAVLAVLALGAWAAPALAQGGTDEARPRLNLYGFVQTDAGYDFGRIDPGYQDRLRVSALPSGPTEFGRDGRTYFSIRQSRFGLKSWYPTELGQAYGVFEFDLVGSGADVGKTIPRLRHAYMELGAFGAGQYWSPFVDVDAWPSIYESFGPTGLPWVRNIQLRWMPLRGATAVTVAIEKPGASGEGGSYEEEIALQGVQLRFRTPEWVASVRRSGDWGHVQVAGLLRRIWWDDLTDDAVDLSGDATGWGINATAILNLEDILGLGERDRVRVKYLIGEGVQNYLNDGTADVAPRPNPGNPARPIEGEALGVWSLTGYVEMFRGKWGAVAGFSVQDIDNAAGQAPDAFGGGTYATFTVVHSPATNLTWAAEYQYGRRKNFSDGWRYDDSRLQFTVRYTFSEDLLAE